MGDYQFEIHIKATPERVFDLWTDLDRMKDWIGGVTRVTDVTGTQRFVTRGLISAVAARIFATGSYRGSFRGELAEFARLAEK